MTARQPGTVLELDAVTKTYPSQPPVQALRGVSFTVRQGELAAISGPSGSGKTTLLHLMGTLDRPSTGTVRVTGLDVVALSDRELSELRATRIGFVFQQFFLAEHQTHRRVAAGAARAAQRGRHHDRRDHPRPRRRRPHAPADRDARRPHRRRHRRGAGRVA